MAEPASDADRWIAARAVARELSQTGIDPLDVAAAQTARTVLLRRFALDGLLIFSIVALVASIGLFVFRGIQGDSALSGREIIVATISLVLLLAVVVVRTMLPARAGAYETAWDGFVQRVWPGAPKGEDLGTARLEFVKRAHSPAGAEFPAAAPGRKK